MVRVLFDMRDDGEMGSAGRSLVSDSRSGRPPRSGQSSRSVSSKMSSRRNADDVSTLSARSTRSTRSAKSTRSMASHQSREEILQKAINDVSSDYICSISRELMVDPVVAEDGLFYERSEIERYIKTKPTPCDLKSPVTRQPMGPSLKTAVTVRHTIQTLVRSGAITGKKAKRWEEKIQREGNRNAELVQEMEEKAIDGSANAMYNLGVWHQFGRFGFEKNPREAFRWYMKSADLNDPCGLANAGCCLLWGLGTEANQIYGMYLLSTAATTESDFAAKILGDIFHEGMLGMPKDLKKSRHWYQQALDVDPKYRQLTPKERESIGRKIRKLHAKSMEDQSSVREPYFSKRPPLPFKKSSKKQFSSGGSVSSKRSISSIFGGIFSN